MSAKTKRCVYCGVSNKQARMTVDHFVPHGRAKELNISRGYLIHAQSNQVCACEYCNHEKSDMLPVEWFSQRPEYKVRFLRAVKHVSRRVWAVSGLSPAERPHHPIQNIPPNASDLTYMEWEAEEMVGIFDND